MIFAEKKAEMVPYTITKCESCGSADKRRFAPDDYLYKESECGRCGQAEVILGIYGEGQDA